MKEKLGGQLARADEVIMKRRDLLALRGGVAALRPLTGVAQYSSVRVIGFLHQGPQAPPALMQAFIQGLADAGIESRDVRIEHRAADGYYDRLPGLAEDLVNRGTAVIAADFLPASLAAKTATQTIPIVFLTGSDPIAAGLVSSFNHPTGNVTGVAFMFTRLGPKNLEFLHELLPNTGTAAVLVNQTNPNGPPQVEDLQMAAHSLGLISKFTIPARPARSIRHSRRWPNAGSARRSSLPMGY